MTRTPPAAALAVVGLTKRFAAVAALTDVDLTVRPGSVHALLGGNGSGKSTLVKVLAGVYRADSGQVRVDGRVLDARQLDAAAARDAGLRFVHQDLGLIDSLSVAENIALAEGFPTGPGGRIGWRTLRRRVSALLERYDIAADADTPVSALRPATRTMVAIARALGDGAQDRLVLVLDEPTASLPDYEVQTLLAAVRAGADRGQATLLISHHLQEVLSVADDLTVLRDGRLAGTMTRADASEAAIVQLMAGRTVSDLRQISAAESHLGPERLGLGGFAAGRLTGVDLSVRAGEVVGVAGLLGSGRSTLLRAIFGAVPHTGALQVDGAPVRARDPQAAIDAGIALVPEDRGADAAFGAFDVTGNMSAAVVSSYWRGGFMRRRAERRDAAALMTTFAVKSPSPSAPFLSLSGGNQQKAILARWLRRSPRVLLLDEPTQGVDVVARTEIYRQIKSVASEGCAVLVASSDFDELSILCDRVVLLQSGGVAGQLTRRDISTARLTELVHTEAARTPGSNDPTHLDPDVTSVHAGALP